MIICCYVLLAFLLLGNGNHSISNEQKDTARQGYLNAHKVGYGLHRILHNG